MSTRNAKKISTAANHMTVANLIQQLQQVNPELPVWVSDGMDYRFYNLDSTVTVEEFVNDAGITVCDIGVGYCREGE